VQVIMMGVAAILGLVTCVAQATVLITQISMGLVGGEEGEEGPANDGGAAGGGVKEGVGAAGADAAGGVGAPGAKGGDQGFQEESREQREAAAASGQAASGQFALPDMPRMQMPELPKIDMPELPKIDMPEVDLGFSFEDFSALVVEKLSPVEHLSPFKVGQIQQLIADRDEEMGKFCAPYFAVVIVVFLLAFVGYVVTALVALVLDARAMDCACAQESYLWLYVLMVLVVPTLLGLVVALIQGALQIAFPFKDTDAAHDRIRRVGDMLLAIPAPLLNLALGVLGLLLLFGMEDDCAEFYWVHFGMLLVVFYIQVALTLIGGLFGLLTLVAMVIGLVNSAFKAVRESARAVAEPSSHAKST